MEKPTQDGHYSGDIKATQATANSKINRLFAAPSRLYNTSLMFSPSPPQASPAQNPRTNSRAIREHSLIIFRNNFLAVFGILFLNWFFPIYPQIKIFLIPAPWLRAIHVIELSLLFVVFGFNTLVALVSIVYPPPFYPALKPPPVSPAFPTPVKRPIRGVQKKYTRPQIGSSPPFSSSERSGYVTSTATSPQSQMVNHSVDSRFRRSLNFSQSGMSSSLDSTNSLPLAAYRSRHPRRPSEPIGTRFLEDLMADDAKTSPEVLPGPFDSSVLLGSDV